MPLIFLTGAGGFIGRRLARALEAAGHRVRRAQRPQFDFSRPVTWREHLRGVDVVINAAGIFRESREATFEAVHVRGPLALFEAAAAAGASVVQISALGADENARSRFHLTKRQADEGLLALGIPAVVLQPSLVYGPGGASARLFAGLASLPLVPLPGDGGQLVQPLHIDDLCAAVVAIVNRGEYPRARIALVGAAPLTLRDFLGELRGALGFGKPRFVHVPMAAMRQLARVGVLLDEDALGMLLRGSTADPRGIAGLLGRAPRAPREFDDESGRSAALAWLLPLLRVGIAMVWIIAGVVSLGLYPREESFALLARTGITGVLAPVALYGAAGLDLALGIATLLTRRRSLWLAQIAVVLVYTAILTVAIPELWLHPFGPLAKNLPLLAALLALFVLEER
jgi:uncharacterized protein YbjT (DUF2867 family)